MDYRRGLLQRTYRPSPFGINQALTAGPRLVRVASVTDGLSNTQFVSELSRGRTTTSAGPIWVDDPGGGLVHDTVHPQREPGYPASPWACGPATAYNNVDNVPSFVAPDQAPAPRLRARCATASPSSSWHATNRVVRATSTSAYAKPPSRRSQYPLWRRLGSLHEKLDQPLRPGSGSVRSRRRSDQLRFVLTKKLSDRSFTLDTPTLSNPAWASSGSGRDRRHAYARRPSAYRFALLLLNNDY